jgi:hypothetical protein
MYSMQNLTVMASFRISQHLPEGADEKHKESYL